MLWKNKQQQENKEKLRHCRISVKAVNGDDASRQMQVDYDDKLLQVLWVTLLESHPTYQFNMSQSLSHFFLLFGHNFTALLGTHLWDI